MKGSVALVAVACLILYASGCDDSEKQNGCMIVGNDCLCGYGCKTDYIYKNRRECRFDLRSDLRTRAMSSSETWDKNGNSLGLNKHYPGEHQATLYKNTRAYPRNNLATLTPPPPPATLRDFDICSSMVCGRGICIQTAKGPGFTCKCAGTGFYGVHCERECPTSVEVGAVYPHECIVI